MNKQYNDFEDWYKFVGSSKKQEKSSYTKLSEKGQILLEKVKNSIKNNKINDTFYVNSEQNVNFALEKDKSFGIDRKSDKLLKQGKYHIDYKIDLHGFTLEEAHFKIEEVFEKAKKNNYRCLLIITGKGIHSKTETIKESLEGWFKEPYFSNKIIKWTDAQQKDGGSGAVYVLLKKFN